MKPKPFDPAKHLDNPDIIRAYVEEQQAYIAELQGELRGRGPPQRHGR